MSLEANDSFIRLSLKEISTDDEFYTVLEKIVNHLQISFVNLGASENGISITREEFLDSFVGTYTIKETGSGLTVGLFKNVEGVLIPVSFVLPGEIRLLQGGETGELIPPKGWEIVDDEEIQHRYNIGTSPNWKVAAIRYTGI